MKIISKNDSSSTSDSKKTDSKSKFKLIPPEYDRSDFVIPANDDNGHSVPLHFRCSQAYLRRVAVATNCPKFPYKTHSDLLRHALHRHLEFLDEIESEFDGNISDLDAVNEIINAENESIAFAKTFDSLSRSAEKLSDRGEQGQAKKLVLKVLRKVEKMTPGYWKDSHIKALKSKFKHFLPDE